MAQQVPRKIDKDMYYTALNNSFGRGFLWADHFNKDDKPTANTHVYIVPPHSPPYVEQPGMPGENLNFLWSDPGNNPSKHPKDRCHLTLQFTEDSFDLRNVHLTIASGQYVRERWVKLSVERQAPQGKRLGPTRRANLVNDTVDEYKLIRAFEFLLQNAYLHDKWKQPVRNHVGDFSPANPWAWRPGAYPLVLQQCEAMLTELQLIMADFGIGMNEYIPNTFP
ncbi:hypothetical protein CGLO_00154 [Colletotrichum gloeosporioides Cg-14]|uniref:Uncharacterized protein n=1 Tax=Colletotrichum gloeosporioides (strain Cg-14) TaxID=1237896 RepID=T0KVC2_COLGC|nr:hypothetical protein CGLO_00154 [Colletotrichum gloeosporioides Cg-14]